MLASLTLSFLSISVLPAATVIIDDQDPPGVGFKDPSPRAPVGGNNGATLGQQRLIAFQQAANIWGATLTSDQTIVVRGRWEALSCTSNSAVLGSAGARFFVRDFTGQQFGSTWYAIALANKLANTDHDPPSGPDTGQDISARFNVNIGTPGCLDSAPWYLGLDGNEGSGIDLVAVLLHEIGHGLGFLTRTPGNTGQPSNGFFTVYDRFLVDDNTGLSWLTMTNEQRMASALNGQLAWNGPQAVANSATILTSGRDSLNKPLMHAPDPFQGGSSVSHYAESAFPNMLMEPRINRDLTHNVAPPFDMSFPLLADIGWVPTELPSTITKAGGNGQRAGVNTTFRTPVAVAVTPAVEGIQVTWTINPVGGAGGTFATTGTRFAVSNANASGIAEAPAITASSSRGDFTLNATAPGAGTTTFNLRAVTPTRP